MTKNIETFLRNNMGYELIEIVAAAIMLIYLWLEYKASIWLWPVGVVIPLFYIYIYFVNKFYADMGINIYYLVASAYGWFRWWKSESALKRKSLRSGETAVLGAAIRYTPKTYWPKLLAVFCVLFALIAWGLIRFTDSPVPLGDAFTTALSIVAMWMLAQKYIEQWWFWLIVNAVSATLYFWKGMTPTAVTYVVYSIVPVFGYRQWQKMMTSAMTANRYSR